MPQDVRCLAAGIGHVVPRCQRGGVLRAMADEDAEVMQPRRGMEDVVIVGLILGEPFREAVEPRLVAELVRRLCFCADIL